MIVSIIGWLLFLATLLVPFPLFLWLTRRYKRPNPPLEQEQQIMHADVAKTCLAAATGMLVVLTGLVWWASAHADSQPFGINSMGAAVLFGLAGMLAIFIVAARGVKHARLANLNEGHVRAHKALVATAHAGLLVDLGVAAAMALGGLAWGRPLRVAGKIVKPSLRSGKEWAQGDAPDCSGLNEPTRRALEALWLHDAKKEHASIPAFSRIGWHLTAVAAPPELLRDVCLATIQEIEHAKKCFALAAGFGGSAHTVMPMPEMLDESFRIVGNPYVHLAVESLSDGCMLEGFNADTAQHSAEICRDPASLKLIRQIAREERSHAELSWRILQFCHQQSPQEVADAVLVEMEKLAVAARPTATSSELLPLVLQADQQALRDYGRLPDAQFDALWAARMKDTKERLLLVLDRVDEDERALAGIN